MTSLIGTFYLHITFSCKVYYILKYKETHSWLGGRYIPYLLKNHPSGLCVVGVKVVIDIYCHHHSLGSGFTSLVRLMNLAVGGIAR